MKYLIIGKKQLIAIGIFILCIIIAVFAAIASRRNTVQTQGAAKKKLPIYSVGRNEKLVSLTFDAAWGDSDTKQLLEIFDKYNVKVTIFVTGDWVDRCAASAKAFFDAGHEIMNHSDTHPHMSKISKEQIITEINDCNDKIEKITGVRPNLHRAPYGEYNDLLIDTLKDMGVYTIQWNIDSLDWKKKTAQEMHKIIFSKMRPGSIVLFHNEGQHTPEALPGIIEKLLEDGYQIVPVSQNIYYDNYTLDHEGKQVLTNQ